MLTQPTSRSSYVFDKLWETALFSYIWTISFIFIIKFCYVFKFLLQYQIEIELGKGVGVVHTQQLLCIICLLRPLPIVFSRLKNTSPDNYTNRLGIHKPAWSTLWFTSHAEGCDRPLDWQVMSDRGKRKPCADLGGGVRTPPSPGICKAFYRQYYWKWKNKLFFILVHFHSYTSNRINLT